MPTGGRTSARGGPSHYRGVVWHKSNSKWEARIYEGGKQKFLGYFTNEDEAALSYDDYAVRIHGSAAKLNFPDRYAGVELPPPTHPPPAARQNAGGSRTAAARAKTATTAPATAGVSGSRVKPTAGPARRASNNGIRVQPVKGSSRFRGVSWNSNCSKWRAQVWKGSEVHHLGYFEHEEDAARAYDEAVLRIRGPEAPTNYPRAHYGGSEEDVGGTVGLHGNGTATQGGTAAASQGGAGRKHQDKDKESDSRMLGVSWSDSHQAWLGEIWDGQRYKFLGAFTAEADAAKAYDVACLAQHGDHAIINFPLATYEAEMAAVALTSLADDAQGGEELWNTHQDLPAGNSRASTPSAYHSSDEMDVVKEEKPVEIDAAAAAVAVVSAEGVPAVAVHRGTSRYQGVSWDRRKGRWFSQIQIRGNRKFLGYYQDELAAARAYDAAAVKLHGASAALNFPNSGSFHLPAAAAAAAAPAPSSDSASEAVVSLKPWLAAERTGSGAVPTAPKFAPRAHHFAPVAPTAAAAPAMNSEERLSRLAGHLFEYLNAQRQPSKFQAPSVPQPAPMLPLQAPSSGLSPAAHNALVNMLRAAAARQQEAAAAATAAREEQMAAQQRMAVAAAIEQWARAQQQQQHQQAPPAAPLPLAAPVAGTKRGFSEYVTPAAAYQAALASWVAKKPRVF